MLCLLKSHGMCGFIDGTVVSHEQSSSVSSDHDTTHWLWSRSDALVKGWILGSLSEQTLTYVTDRLTQQSRNAADDDFSAKQVWDELQTTYAPAILPPQVLVVTDTPQDQERAKSHQELYQATLVGNWVWIYNILRIYQVTVIDKITNNGNTALHVAVGATKKPEFLEKMLGLIPENTQLLDLRNSDGSTLLHVAAIIGNTEAAKILVPRN